MFKRKRQKRIIAGQVNVLENYKKVLFVLVILVIVSVFSYASLLFLTVAQTNNIELSEKRLDKMLVQNTELNSQYLSLKSEIIGTKKKDFVLAKNIKYLNTSLSGFAINFKRK